MARLFRVGTSPNQVRGVSSPPFSVRKAQTDALVVRQGRSERDGAWREDVVLWKGFCQIAQDGAVEVFQGE